MIGRREFAANLHASTHGTIYHPEQIERFLEDALPVGIELIKRGNTKPRLVDCIAAFDTEFTSFEISDGGELRPAGTVYAWAFGLNGLVTVGRRLEDFVNWVRQLSAMLKLSPAGLNLRVYVHNLGADWQYLRRWFEWPGVFARSAREPMRATTDCGIEFADSLCLTGRSLASWGDSLRRYPVKKLVGDLDYHKSRHYLTPLTDREWGYIVHDVLVVMSGIKEKQEQEDDQLHKIPMTKTGYARRLVRDRCLADKSYKRYVYSTVLTVDEYILARSAFAGGYTHGSANYIGDVIDDCISLDFTSSYPYQMCVGYFPMSKGRRVDCSRLTKSRFEELVRTKCCIMRIRLTNIRERPEVPDHYLSRSKCTDIVGDISDNGRIVSAKQLVYTCTELDYEILCKVYQWDKLEISNLWYYKRGYLPKEYIETVLDLYGDKTELKGVPGAEEIYMLSKEQVNSLYGMMVTDIARSEVAYKDGQWSVQPADIPQAVESYNNDRRRFLSYLWGVWVTAHARAAIWGYVPGYGWCGGIVGMGDNYIYSDTDSLKVTLLPQSKIDELARYNEICARRLLAMCQYYDINPERVHPKTVNGVEKWLGVYDFDGYYYRFETLGAKRYMVEDSGGYSLTVSGVNKRSAIPYLLTQTDDPFTLFRDGLLFPVLPNGESACGKNLHKYQDERIETMITDYQGNTVNVVERSALYIAPTSYTLGMPSEFVTYLTGRKEKKSPA